MPQGEDTVTGETGLRLSGGQQKRLALARTLAHPRPILILDDPFSALDKTTEVESVLNTCVKMVPDSIIFLISHRLYLFSETDGVIWMDNGTAEFSSHKKLLKDKANLVISYLGQAVFRELSYILSLELIGTCSRLIKKADNIHEG